MDRNLVALKPALVWKHFAEIVRIPRPSSHEEKIRRYILDFARAQGLESKEDAAHNVYVRKPASKGMEDRKGVILQAHLDMVPQKNNDKEFDFTKDPIDAYIDGGWVTADGTTLGADNGIGVAAILAVLEDRTLKHGPLEALFTATEETGMDGANGLEKGLLHGDILLNLDSEEEGELYVGCAGGLDANMTFGYKAEPTPAGGYTAAKISVKGLKGGHSGIQIVCQRANANKVLFRFLNAAPCDVLLASVDGGGLRNAIPREAEAVVLVETGDYDEFAAAMAEPEPPFPIAKDVIEGYFDPSETPAYKRMADLLEDVYKNPPRDEPMGDGFTPHFNKLKFCALAGVHFLYRRGWEPKKLFAFCPPLANFAQRIYGYVDKAHVTPEQVAAMEARIKPFVK